MSDAYRHRLVLPRFDEDQNPGGDAETCRDSSGREFRVRLLYEPMDFIAPEYPTIAAWIGDRPLSHEGLFLESAYHEQVGRSDEFMRAAQAVAGHSWWQKHAGLGDIPCVFAADGRPGVAGFIFKQDDNGLTFVVVPSEAEQSDA